MCSTRTAYYNCTEKIQQGAFLFSHKMYLLENSQRSVNICFWEESIALCLL